MKSLASVTTSLTSKSGALAGAGPGSGGAGNGLVVSESTARDWLLRQRDPAATDAALVHSLTSTLGVTVSPRTELRFPVVGGYHRVVTGCGVELPTPESAGLALTKVEQALTPATSEQAEGWLVMLQASTAHRTDDKAAGAVAYAVYASELRRWPADVAKAVCEGLARGLGRPPGPNWFPTLAEIIQECERLSAPRRAMRDALERRCRSRA